jgi:hypothetical protein
MRPISTARAGSTRALSQTRTDLTANCQARYILRKLNDEHYLASLRHKEPKPTGSVNFRGTADVTAILAHCDLRATARRHIKICPCNLEGMLQQKNILLASKPISWLKLIAQNCLRKSLGYLPSPQVTFASRFDF